METQNTTQNRGQPHSHRLLLLCAAQIPQSPSRLRKQFQKGGNDCGLFAIAFATDLPYGRKIWREFNLVVWRLKHEPPNLIPPIFYHDVIDAGVWERSHTSS